jgi:transposase InsO family protein
VPLEIRDAVVDSITGLSKTEISLNKLICLVGISKSRFFDWKKRYHVHNKHNGQLPKQTWILPSEKAAIIDYYGKNPGIGCKRLSYMMVDEDVACVSHNTVYRVLKGEGLLEPSNSKPSLKGTGFDQPTRKHEQWHIDISYINAGGTFYYLCSVLDGYSRFIVHWDIQESMKQEDCQLIVQRAKENVGAPNVRLISDNGPQFKAKQFKSFLKKSGMDQTFTSPYYPQSNGKIERWHKELKKDCVRPKAPRDLKEAKKFIGEFIEHYNYARLHSAIGYATPFDKMLGIESELFSSRKRKLAEAKIRRRVENLKLMNKKTESCPRERPHQLDCPSDNFGNLPAIGFEKIL